MRAVVDTNVTAYYVLGTPEFDAEVREFWRRVEDPIAPALWKQSWLTYCGCQFGGGVLSKEDAPTKLRLAARLGIHSVSVRKLWQGALQRALESGVAVYDTLLWSWLIGTAPACNIR